MLLVLLLLVASCITPGFSDSYCFVGVNDATNCSQCDINAECARGDSAKCTCTAGFFGNGLTCKTAAECGEINCCKSGYQWNSTSQCCDQTYCDLPCANDELCDDSVRDTFCLCNPATYARYANTNISAVLSCNSSGYTVSVSKCLLEDLEFNSASIHLNNPACTGVPVITGNQRMMSISVSQNIQQCGTIMMNNETHVILLNNIFIEPPVIDNIISKSGIMIPVSCAYPNNMVVGLPSPINTTSSYMTLPGISGSGNFPASFSIYQYSNFTNAYPKDNLNVPINTPLYVGIVVPGIANTNLAVNIDQCYAAPTNSSSDPNKFILINNGCPATSVVKVQIIENGQGSEAKLMVPAFKFTNSPTFFLTCLAHLCDNTNHTCPISCPAVSRLSAGDQGIAIVGPFNITGSFYSSVAAKEFPLLQTIFSALLLLLLNRI